MSKYSQRPRRVSPSTIVSQSARSQNRSGSSSPSRPLFDGSAALVTDWDPAGDQGDELGPLLQHGSGGTPRSDRFLLSPSSPVPDYYPPPDSQGTRHRPPALSIKKTRFAPSQHYPGEQYSLGESTASDRPFLLDQARDDIEESRPIRRPATGKLFSGRNPLSDSYESPAWFHLMIFTILVFLSYPALWVTTLAAQDKSLFWTRLIVGGACGVLGFALGIALTEISRRVLEAATWATVIHLSLGGDQHGILFRDFAKRTDYLSSTWISFVLLFERLTKPTFSRALRPYDRRLWSFFVVLFLVAAVTSACLTFAFGRIIVISTRDVHQRNIYTQTAVIGDLTPDDVARASQQVNAFTDFVRTWTLTPFSGGITRPQPVALPFESDTVYFAETFANQLWAGGSGFGTFRLNASMANQPSDFTNNGMVNMNPDLPGGGLPTGALLRWPRWGIRIKCTKLPDQGVNLVPTAASNLTYAFVPRSTLSALFNSLSLVYPSALNQPFNTTRLLELNDTLPATIDPTSIAWGGKWWPTGFAQSFMSSPADDTKGAAGTGWVQLEMIIIRLNNSYTPLGTFGSYGPKASDGSQIGYDAAVCVEAIEPYIVESYNVTIGSGFPSTMSIMKRGDRMPTGDANDASPWPGVQVGLNSSDKWNAYVSAHDNARNQILKDNGRDYFYVPSPTLVSFTDGEGPEGYTSLSTDRLERALGLADASLFLPYLVGSQPVVAYAFMDDTLASAQILVVPCVLTLVGVLILGYICAFMVPKLPLGIPRRDFGLMSWLAALEGDQLVKNRVRLGRHMSLEEIEDYIGDLRVRYGTKSATLG